MATTTGKNAKPALPKIVAWIRHSSFIIAEKRSGTGIASHQVEEGTLKAAAGPGEPLCLAAVEELPVVEDPDPVADLLGDLEDMGGYEDGPAVTDILLQEILDRPLHDGV